MIRKKNWDNFFCRYCSCFCQRQWWCRLKCAIIHLFNFRNIISRAFEFWHYQSRSHFHIVNTTIKTPIIEFNQDAIHFSTFPKWLQQSKSHNKWMTLEKIFAAKNKFTHADIKRLISSPKKDKRALLTFHLHAHHSSSLQTSTLSSRHVSKTGKENFSHIFSPSTCALKLACICVNELCPLNFKKSSLPSSRSELLPSKSCGLLSDSSSAKMNWGQKR